MIFFLEKYNFKRFLLHENLHIFDFLVENYFLLIFNVSMTQLNNIQKVKRNQGQI